MQEFIEEAKKHRKSSQERHENIVKKAGIESHQKHEQKLGSHEGQAYQPMAHRRDDQELIHEQFRHSEETTPGIYMGVNAFHRGSDKEFFMK